LRQCSFQTSFSGPSSHWLLHILVGRFGQAGDKGISYMLILTWLVMVKMTFFTGLGLSQNQVPKVALWDNGVTTQFLLPRRLRQTCGCPNKASTPHSSWFAHSLRGGHNTRLGVWKKHLQNHCKHILHPCDHHPL
jgi:hypothetical protein